MADGALPWKSSRHSAAGTAKHSRSPHPSTPILRLHAHVPALQELDEAGEWESLLSSAGLINSPADYTQSSQGSGSEAGDGGAAKSPGSGSML